MLTPNLDDGDKISAFHLIRSGELSRMKSHEYWTDDIQNTCLERVF